MWTLTGQMRRGGDFCKVPIGTFGDVWRLQTHQVNDVINHTLVTFHSDSGAGGGGLPVGVHGGGTNRCDTSIYHLRMQVDTLRAAPPSRASGGVRSCHLDIQPEPRRLSRKGHRVSARS